MPEIILFLQKVTLYLFIQSLTVSMVEPLRCPKALVLWILLSPWVCSFFKGLQGAKLVIAQFDQRVFLVCGRNLWLPGINIVED